MTPNHSDPAGGVRPARVDDIARMQWAGGAAGMRFAEIDDPRIAACADDDAFDDAELRGWISAGRAWVAIDGDDVVGYAVVDMVDGRAHIEEVSVHPDHERRGHGAHLIETVCAWSQSRDLDAVTLTTFAEVPWNRPYYERRGFHVVDASDIGEELRKRVLDEERHGLPSELRVCMSRLL